MKINRLKTRIYSKLFYTALLSMFFNISRNKPIYFSASSSLLFSSLTTCWSILASNFVSSRQRLSASRRARRTRSARTLDDGAAAPDFEEEEREIFFINSVVSFLVWTSTSWTVLAAVMTRSVAERSRLSLSKSSSSLRRGVSSVSHRA